MPPNQITKEAVEAVLIPAGNKVTWLGSGGAAVMSFLHSNLGVLSGILIAVLGYLTSLYFQRRRDKREERQLAMEEREHQRRMERMRSRPVPLEGEPL
jgi:Lysis protein S.